MSAGLTRDLLGALIFAILFLPLLGLSEWLRRRFRVGPETTRKVVHIGGGLLSLSLPWLVRSLAVVLAMSLLLALALLWAQRHAALRGLHGVQRRSRGTVYFPLAVALVYLLAEGRVWLYVCALLVLAVADAFAALIGCAYGRLRYEVDDESKSLEGSVVFLLIAFLTLHLPMLLMTDLPRVVCVLAALLVAVLVTGFEAVSLAGADNIFIPLGVVVILAKITTKPVDEILYQSLSLVMLSLGIALAARRAGTFNAGGTIMFTLFVYGAWSLGSERWALPILSCFLVYALVRLIVRPKDGRQAAPVRPRILFRVLVVPLLLLVCGNMFRQGPRLYAPFLVALAAVLAFSLTNHFRWSLAPTGRRRVALATLAGLCAWAACAVPAWLWLPMGRDGTSLALSACLVLAAALLDDRLLGACPSFAGERAWPAVRLPLAAAAAVAMLLARLSWIG